MSISRVDLTFRLLLLFLLLLCLFLLQGYSKDHASFFSSTEAEKKLVDDVKKLSAEHESKRQGRVDSENVL